MERLNNLLLAGSALMATSVNQPYNPKQRRGERMLESIDEYLRKHKNEYGEPRSYKEEYDLILKKESDMSSKQRAFLSAAFQKK